MRPRVPRRVSGESVSLHISAQWGSMGLKSLFDTPRGRCAAERMRGRAISPPAFVAGVDRPEQERVMNVTPPKTTRRVNRA